jgi:hypothetical protein
MKKKGISVIPLHDMKPMKYAKWQGMHLKNSIFQFGEHLSTFVLY